MSWNGMLENGSIIDFLDIPSSIYFILFKAFRRIYPSPSLQNIILNKKRGGG
jgi:hypothetical protein